MPEKRLSLKWTFFIIILSVAILCIVTSAVLAMVLASREVNKRLEQDAARTEQARDNTTVTPGQKNPPLPPEQRNPSTPTGRLPSEPLPPVPGGVPPWLWICFLIAGAAGLLVALGLSFWMSKRLSRPLSKLTVAAAGIADGEYGSRVDAGGGREMEELASAFNALSEKLERNEELRNNMVADIAHELRTPLTTLRGDFEAVKDGLLQPDAAVMDNLLGDIQVLTRLVEDLQQLSLAEAGQLKLELAEMDVKEVVDEVAARFENEFAGKGVSLGTSVDTGLPAIKADRLRIAQVLGNLVKNSLAHTTEGGSVEVRGFRSGPEVTFSVSDDGSGIAHDELPFIFERFTRVDRSRTRKTGGSGLGLTIARTLVSAHGGRIWAESEPGKGTTLSFSLPA